MRLILVFAILLQLRFFYIHQQYIHLRTGSTDVRYLSLDSSLKKEIDSVREEMNDILADQNDINESTRAQLEAISAALVELQSSRSQITTLKKRIPIGFIQPKEEDNQDD